MQSLNQIKSNQLNQCINQPTRLNQINQINQIEQIDQINQLNQFDEITKLKQSSNQLIIQSILQINQSLNQSNHKAIQINQVS